MHIVHVWAVKFKLAQVFAGKVAQFGNRANAELMPTVLADPNGQRRAPVAIPTQSPIDVVLQPVAEPSFFDVLGHPVDILVKFNHAFLNLAGADEPCGPRHV